MAYGISIPASELVADFNTNYRAGSFGESQLKTLLRQKSHTPSVARPVVTSDNVYTLSLAELGEVVQPFQTKWTPKGPLEFVPNEIRLRRLKADWQGEPDELVDTWLGFLSGLPANIDRKTWPFVRWFVEVHFKQRITHDMEKKVYGKGVYTAPTPGTAGTARMSMDGIEQILKDGLANAERPMNQLDVPAKFTGSNSFEVIESIMDQVFEHTPEAEGEDFIIGVEPKIAKYYYRDDRNTHGANMNYNPANNLVQFSDLAGGGMRIVPMPCLAGTGVVFATPANNFLDVRKSASIPMPRVENVDRTVKIYTDWHEGLGFGVNELVWANTATGNSLSGSAAG